MQAGETRTLKIMIIVVLLSLLACTSTRSYRPVVNNLPPLVPGDAYELRFLDGKREATVIAKISDDGFTDRAGHAHMFSEIDEVREKRFSFLKTTGVVAGSFVVFAAVGMYLIGKALGDMLTEGSANMVSESMTNSESNK